MLIEYKVSNFASIYEEQSFNMLCVKSYKEKDDTNVIKSKQMSLLKSIAIYGPNASGKSTLLKSLGAFRSIILYSSTRYSIDSKLPITPFAFGKTSKEEPTSFEVTFIENNIKYIFGIVLNKERILEEYLISYSTPKPQTWYIRMYDNDNKKYKYKYGSFLKGQKKIWEKSTKKNALFLSTAINLQESEDSQLTPIYNWFSKRLKFVGINGWSNSLSKEHCINSDKKDKIVDFLKSSGIDIKDIVADIETLNIPYDKIEDSELKEALQKAEAMLPSKELEQIRRNIKIDFIHSNGISLPLKSQSDGTKKLFAFASHWLESLENGKVIFIDELNDNFHPALVKLLVDMFNDKVYNANNAQLIFTTHETSILNQEVLRRDQVWFCDRKDNLSTRVYPLSDFKPRKGYENIENSYLWGRYGAVPYFQKVSYKMNDVKE